MKDIRINTSYDPKEYILNSFNILSSDRQDELLLFTYFLVNSEFSEVVRESNKQFHNGIRY